MSTVTALTPHRAPSDNVIPLRPRRTAEVVPLRTGPVHDSAFVAEAVETITTLLVHRSTMEDHPSAVGRPGHWSAVDAYAFALGALADPNDPVEALRVKGELLDAVRGGVRDVDYLISLVLDRDEDTTPPAC